MSRETDTLVRVDMHCHSTASQVARLGLQTALGLPECATPPEEVYDLAKRRGMDFVTITDHDTIDGALELADRPDVFISEELTASFRGEPQQVHVLCYGITPDDHEWLQAHNHDVELIAHYLHERLITCALAHPFYSVAAPLQPSHRRRLAELFGTWETRNGARDAELNAPAVIYVETHGGIGIGGTDDHAGIDIGRTYSQTPYAASPEEFLAHVRAGRVTACGEQGSAARWAHNAMALTVRAIGRGAADGPPPDPAMVLAMIERLLGEAETRGDEGGSGIGPDDAQALLRAWLAAVELDLPEGDLIAYMQTDEFSHADLERRARRRHERSLAAAADRALEAISDKEAGRIPRTGLADAALALFEACVPAVPYAPAAAFLGRERRKVATRTAAPPRFAFVADGVGSVHGVTRTLEEIRERGVPGFEVEVVGTDPSVDRRLPAVAELELPMYPGMKLGVPGLPALVDTLLAGRYDGIHVCAPGPAGASAALAAGMLGLPLTGSFHTELGRYAQLRSTNEETATATMLALRLFYGRLDIVLSPSAAADQTLRELGVSDARIARWDRGVDTDLFTPQKREPGRFGDGINVLYAGRLATEKGVDLLADSFLAARERDPRLHLVLAGGGPEQGRLHQRLGAAATFLGWIEHSQLGPIYASADMFLFCSRTDTFGQVVLEAQASGLPVIAIAAGGPAELIADGRSGILCEPDARVLGDAVVGLASSRAARDRLASGALAATRDRTWEAALSRLAEGWRRVSTTSMPELIAV